MLKKIIMKYQLMNVDHNIALIGFQECVIWFELR